MKKFYVTAIILCLFYSLSAQQDSTDIPTGMEEKKIKLYKTWISLNNSSDKIKGVLYEVQDSSITVSNSVFREDYVTNNLKLSKISYNKIDNLKVRAKNNVGKGALIGSITGMLTGVIIGLIAGDDPEDYILSTSAEEKAVIAGVTLGIGGAAVGAMCGLIRIKIPINGNLGNYNRNKSKLKKYSFR